MFHRFVLKPNKIVGENGSRVARLHRRKRGANSINTSARFILYFLVAVSSEPAAHLTSVCICSNSLAADYRSLPYWIRPAHPRPHIPRSPFSSLFSHFLSVPSLSLFPRPSVARLDSIRSDAVSRNRTRRVSKETTQWPRGHSNRDCDPNKCKWSLSDSTTCQGEGDEWT